MSQARLDPPHVAAVLKLDALVRAALGIDVGLAQVARGGLDRNFDRIGEILVEVADGAHLIAPEEMLPAGVEVLNLGPHEVRVTGKAVAAENVDEVKGRQLAEVRPGQRLAVAEAQVRFLRQRVDQVDAGEGIGISQPG